nr:ABC-three component system protein [uncultured Desulfobulbus sp.]
MTKSRNVPGQAEGYYLQETRFMYHLLKASSGDIVSLEYLGDVATQHADGSVTTEEDKSTIGSNPVTDKSVNLWKTLHNWVLLAESGELDPARTKYVIYVPNKKFTGSFIKILHEANTEENAKKAFESVKNAVWGKAPKFDLKSKVADTISSYVDKVFNNESISLAIIERFNFESGGDAGYKELNAVIKDSPVPPEHADAYRTYFLGWIKESIDKCIITGLTPQISRDEFISETHKILRKFNREGILRSGSVKPTKEAANLHVQKSPTYIQQLELINIEYEDKLTAVCDYLMAEDDRYDWITRGLLHESSADEFVSKLKSTWRNYSGEVKATIPHAEPESQGAAVFFKCCQYSTKIENNELPEHFVPGTFHLLANQPSLGWHPNWSNLLEAKDRKDKP